MPGGRAAGGASEAVLLYTNTLLSAVLFGGKPEQLVEAVRSGRVRGVISLCILHESREVLAGPRFQVAPRIAEDLAVEIAGFMEVVPPGPSSGRWVTDPKDDPIIEAALRGGAAVVVTGDRALLQARAPGIELLTVAEMVVRLE